MLNMENNSNSVDPCYTKAHEYYLKLIQDSLKNAESQGVTLGELSDGYHTFNELYEFRKVYNAVLFNTWNDSGYGGTRQYDVHKSWRHHDGELCFGGGWFIVVAMLPTGQISNHYKAEDWDLFKIPEADKAKYPFDGHTPQNVIERLKAL